MRVIRRTHGRTNGFVRLAWLGLALLLTLSATHDLPAQPISEGDSSTTSEESATRPAVWTVLRDSVETGHAQTRMVGDVVFVDALSMADALNLYYLRDDAGRYVFSLPANPLVYAPGSAFAQVGLDMLHFTVPPFMEEFSFFVPEDSFLDVLSNFLPGTLNDDSLSRTLSYTPPSHQMLSVDCEERAEEWIWHIVMDRPYTGEIALLDTATIALTVNGVKPHSGSVVTGGADLFGAEFVGDPANGRYLIDTPRAIRSARLEGPDPGNVLRLVVTMSDLDGEPAPALAYGQKTLDQSLAEDRKKWKIDKIVIDAGHGGKDPGAIGRAKKTYEKDITLQIALALRDEVQKRTDIEVVMTRDKDVLPTLGERARIANSAGGKLFISIHCNSSTSTRPNGHWTYFLSPARTERAMNVALKENSVIRYEERREDYPDLSEENFILLAMAQAQFVKESEHFATMIQRNMSKKTGLRDRGVDQAGFYVLIGASMPAVLVETAFLSNPREESQLRDRNFRKKIASGICDAIIEFKKGYEE